MRNHLKNYFRRVAEGYENGVPAFLLAPLLGAASRIYGSAVMNLRQLYEKGFLARKRLPFPVISIGNLSWGGTGKTPLVEYLARKLVDRFRTPLILTRGYSQDEVVQFQQHLAKALIGVGKNRVKVAQEFARKNHVDAALLDDGLQHWPLHRDLEIVTVNALNPFGNGKLIPRGILREPLSAIGRAHAVVISHVNLVKADEIKKIKDTIRSVAPEVLIVESYLEPLFFYRAKNRERVILSRLQNRKVTTFSAIGSPRSFQQLLFTLQIKPIRNFEFTDHHPFSEKELREIKEVSESASIEEIVTTEKDFYRASALISNLLNPLILATRLRIKSGEEALNEKIFQLFEKSQK